MDSKNLIFLISLPRSGSTLVQRMLSQHSLIASISEPWMALPLFHGNIFDNIQLKRNVPYNGKTCEIAMKSTFENFPESSDRLKKHFANLYNSICHDIVDGAGKTMFLDKTPRYYHIIGEIIKYFPQSKVIILHRNPFAVLNSILTTWVKNYHPLFLSVYRNDIFLGQKVLSEFRNKKIQNVYQLEFESFIKNTEIELNKLCDFLEIEFEDKMLNLATEAPNWKFGDPVNALKKTIIDYLIINICFF